MNIRFALIFLVLGVTFKGHAQNISGEHITSASSEEKAAPTPLPEPDGAGRNDATALTSNAARLTSATTSSAAEYASITVAPLHVESPH